MQMIATDVLANEPCETELTRQLRAGITHVLLPETPQQLSTMLKTLAVKEIKLPRLILNELLNTRLVLLDAHKKGNKHDDLTSLSCMNLAVLSSLLEYDYPHLEEYYQRLRSLDKPALILWGRQDRVIQ